MSVEKIKTMVEDAIRENKFTACAIGIQKFEEPPVFLTFGHTAMNGGTKIDENTLFDLASLTKVIFTTSLAARLLEDQKIQLDVPLSKISDFKDILKHVKSPQYLDATIEDLLLHRAGFTSIAKYTEVCANVPSNPKAYSEDVSSKLIECVTGVPPRYALRAETIYSDLGFIFLIEVLCMHFKDSAENLWINHVQKPLRLFSIKTPGQVKDSDVIVSSVPGLPAGTLYDPAERFLKKLCGHAGLLGSLRDTVEFGSAWLEAYLQGQSHIQKEIARQFVDPYIDQERRLGWDGVSENSTAGDISKNSIGHLGYTGTSLWVDLDKQIVAVVLTNRTLTQIKHADDFIPSQQKIDFNNFRRDIHNAIWETSLS